MSRKKYWCSIVHSIFCNIWFDESPILFRFIFHSSDLYFREIIRFTVKYQEILPVSFTLAKYFIVLQNMIYKPSSFSGSMFQKNQRHEKKQ